MTAQPAPTPDLLGAGKPSIVGRVALRWPIEVAAALGVSTDTVERWGLIAELRCIRRGRMRLVPVAELERWATDQAYLPLEDQ